MGDSSTGKSCLIKRYCESRFIQKYILTIGVDYGVKPVVVNGQSFKINFWDLSGMDEFFEVRNEFYKDAQGVLMVFDLTNSESFQNCSKWLNEASQHGLSPPQSHLVLVGTKSDLISSSSSNDSTTTEEEVSQHEIDELVQSISQSMKFSSVCYFQTSSLLGEGIEELFDHLVANIISTLS